jgi:hypothetical protein
MVARQQASGVALPGSLAYTPPPQPVVPCIHTCRFTAPEDWTPCTRHQHPCYITSNNIYGLKQPRAFDMPPTYTGARV